MIIEENEIIILEKIYFATDSAEILPKSFPIVDAVAATMIITSRSPASEIQGHADERGADDYNIRLTSDRAASVRQAMIQRGVDANRLRTCLPVASAIRWISPTMRRLGRRTGGRFKIIRTDAGPTGVEVACPAGKELIPSD